MSLLDDVRRLSDASITREGTCWCHFCGSMIEPPESYDPVLPYAEQHASDCPWLAMPRIVAALDAAQSLVDAHYVPEAAIWRVADDPRELGDRQHAALETLWGLGIRPSAFVREDE